VSRRVSLPTADDLFRPTVVPDQPDDDLDDQPADGAAVDPSAAPTGEPAKAKDVPS